jgi:uncharacterized membrane protein YadS
MLRDIILLLAFALAALGTYIPWSKIEGLSAGPRKAVCAVYILSWLVLIAFGLSGINYLYELKEALR